MTTASTTCIRPPASTQHIVDNVDNKGLTPARTASIRRVGSSPQERFSAIFGEKVRLASLSPHRHSPPRAKLALISRRKRRSTDAGTDPTIFAALFHLVERGEFQHPVLHAPIWRTGGARRVRQRLLSETGHRSGARVRATMGDL